MGKRVHILSDHDLVARTAVCANCGPTRIWPRNGTSWQCARGAQPREDHPHRLTKISKADRQAICAICGPTKIRVYARQGRDDVKEYVQCHQVWRERQRRYARKQKYGLTPEAFEALLESQDGLCASCHDSLDKPYVDHDHECCPGKESCGECVRGLVCGPCNTGLGMFQDDPIRLLRAADYLLARQKEAASCHPSR